MRELVVLGSTGSIGRQTLEVVQLFPERFRVKGLAAGKNWKLLREQVLSFRPEAVALAGEEEARLLAESLPPEFRPSIFWGEEGLEHLASWPGTDTVLVAVTGAAGWKPTLAAIKAGKRIALANKETLVVAGEIVVREAQRRGTPILPVDSEHAAIWQCLEGRKGVKRIILTASGGPFREYSLEELAKVRPAEALRHPTWRMGPKITVDSATLMNKGLEVIEAHWLFGLEYDKIKVLIHPQSIVHGLVEFIDGTWLGAMSVTDMRLPILYALSYPERMATELFPLDLARVGTLTFTEPDYERFPCLGLAIEAGKIGGTMPAVLNAANEVAVAAFLEERLPFLGIPAVVEEVMRRHQVVKDLSLEAIEEADAWARKEAEALIKRWG
ncbi:1-deoxy-D-xylulose 5-phosphate reductoisomerase [Ammonifex degensii KC4]|uniref:1-deoxy-D-xylulose 5-phosphate reductoisomerase n=1 Tax=Ammonifex degensii (strain DSM 10501 / KC4) TaxID=429009 RepID=C9RBV7_AMMDK|nr:1-deoxy-D-xylulose-5-phosphate reductoisomerase [Ammonifex degensii]ACX51734.1 1-deoxy-D-xylulose 5-phosphate reductoisomerase [Ammonifex degensii KC4]